MPRARHQQVWQIGALNSRALLEDLLERPAPVGFSDTNMSACPWLLQVALQPGLQPETRRGPRVLGHSRADVKLP